MWQRFTERARRAIMIAQEEAGKLQSEQVTTEHLLLALLGETDSPAAQFLQATDINPEAVRAAIVCPRLTRAAPNGVALSQEAKSLLGDAAQIARELQHNDIDSHHLLLALLGNPKCSAAKMLKPLQHSAQDLHAGLLKQLKEQGTPIACKLTSGSTPVSPNASLFTRFTERSRRVILLAQEEAAQMQTGEIGTHHFFLALLREGEGTAAQTLMRMGMELETVRQAVAALKRPPLNSGGEPKLSPQAKRVLELSAEEACELLHNYIGTEHLLLALLHPDCGLSPLFKQLKLDLDSDRIRQQIVEYLGPPPAVTVPEPVVKETFTDSATDRFDAHVHRVLNASQDEALRVESDFVLPQHLLLALAMETTGVIGQLWQEYGVTTEMMRQAIEMQDWPAETIVQPNHAMMLSLKALRVLELAADEARRLRSRKIGREHLLLALLRSKNNPAAFVLAQWGMKLEDVRTLARHWQDG